ncbi:MAG TPA: glutamine--fructose-6-phosphate transaminase (isomerizing) [Gammaproteobacteria bacterium]|nr:glutamine--fructose-6-phosphate transaminase (isomerizing) [Gammaproteobacteria bacterium]
MCGIVGAVARRPVANLLINGLKKLEYRGYDSAGVALVNDAGELMRLRVVGKVNALEVAMQAHPLVANTGIAHTRWATHGVPSEKNAHPVVSHDEFALVHNGIIENHASLRESLAKNGYAFTSDTDTEVIVHLIHQHFQKTQDVLASVREAVSQLKGAYALAIVSKHAPNRVIAIRQGSPLVLGVGQGEFFVASDPLALLSITQSFIYLEDHDLADVTLAGITIYNQQHEKVTRQANTINIQQDAVERGEYRHYMKKEIMEQPDAVANCLEGRIVNGRVLPAIFGPKAESVFAKVKHVQLVACGTSYHAAMVAKYWIESLAKIPCSVEIASEYRYRELAPTPDSLFVTLSQSGETADTLAALRLAKTLGYVSTLAIVNAPGSTMLREADLQFLTRAGVEIGVASTKAFVTQLTSLFMLALVLKRGHDQSLAQALEDLPELINQVLQQDNAIKTVAKLFLDKHHALFLGRGMMYPIALEGALKLKEISYIHAEGYPAGELKHGPLALVDKTMPVVVTVPSGDLFEKTMSNLQEVRARGGELTIFTDQPAAFKEAVFADAEIIAVPSINPLLAPILYAIPMQLLAYHVAVLKGTDVDQPRNLAKSVTVE